MKNVFEGLFSDEQDVFRQFNVKEEDQKDVEILYAVYTDEDYSGSAFVLFSRKGKLYEANGSHCSCFGLEDQWEPEETSLEALEKRNYFYASVKLDEIKAAVKRWKARERTRNRIPRLQGE